jgi:hypothetical protein
MSVSLKDLLRSQLFGAYMGRTVLRYLADDLGAALPLIASGELSVATMSRLAARKKSDELFILGSGSSICRYRDSDWARIERGDSFGFNFWIVHDFVPDYYGVERPDGEPEKLYELMRIKEKEYARPFIILKGAENLRIFERDKVPGYRGRFNVTFGGKIPGENEVEVASALRWLRRSQRALGRLGLPLLPSRRASIVYNTIFGALLGYREIVLCGVDLNNVKYFFDEDAQHYRRKGIPVPWTAQTGAVHRTFDRTYRSLTVDRLLDVIDRELLRPAGIRLWVGSTSSALYPRFSCFFSSTR